MPLRPQLRGLPAQSPPVRLRPRGKAFLTQLCPAQAKEGSQCANGSLCGLAHCGLEVDYHPLRYKAVRCQAKDCGREECPAYHSEEDRRAIGPELLAKVFRVVPRNRLVEGTYKNDL